MAKHTGFNRIIAILKNADQSRYHTRSWYGEGNKVCSLGLLADTISKEIGKEIERGQDLAKEFNVSSTFLTEITQLNDQLCDSFICVANMLEERYQDIEPSVYNPDLYQY